MGTEYWLLAVAFSFLVGFALGVWCIVINNAIKTEVQ